MGFYDASTLGSTAMTLQLGGAISSIAGSFYSAQAQRDNLRFQADMASINARIAEQSAQSALDAGNRQVGALTLKAGQLKSGQRAAMAANGVDLGQGSAAEVLASTDLMKEIDVNTLTANAVRSAWGYRTQGVNYQNQALLARSAASSISPMASAATSLLSSAGSVASNWYALDKAGALDTMKANMSSDPIGSMGESRGWWK